jgi:hypothetical protein
MAAQIGTGTSLTRGTTSIGEVISASIGSAERASIDISHLGLAETTSTTQVGSMTFTPGALVNPGELSAEVNFEPGQFLSLKESVQSYSVTFPNGAAFGASGFVTASDVQIPFEDRITGNVTIKLTGAISYTAAT